MSPNQKSTAPLPQKNQLLAALPAEDYERLAPHLKPYKMNQGEVLYLADQAIRHAYFPIGSMISVVANTSAGGAVEVGVVGNEGMTGISVVLGVDKASADAIVQLPNDSVRLAAETLIEEFQRGGAFQQILLRYTNALLTMVAQTAACNRLHHASERLARWLLMCQDRTKSEYLPLTHEFLGMMLGVRRSGVTEIAVGLQAEELIHYKRGMITITDRKGLEQFACECYGVIRAAFDQDHHLT